MDCDYINWTEVAQAQCMVQWWVLWWWWWTFRLHSNKKLLGCAEERACMMDIVYMRWWMCRALVLRYKGVSICFQIGCLEQEL